MDTAGRGRTATFARVTMIALILLAVCFAYEQLLIEQDVNPVLMVFLVVDLAIAGAIGRGWRWGPLAGAIWATLVLLFSLPIILSDLDNPAALHQFLWQVVATALTIVCIVSGIGATLVRGRGTAERRSINEPSVG